MKLQIFVNHTTLFCLHKYFIMSLTTEVTLVTKQCQTRGKGTYYKFIKWMTQVWFMRFSVICLWVGASDPFWRVMSSIPFAHCPLSKEIKFGVTCLLARYITFTLHSQEKINRHWLLNALNLSNLCTRKAYLLANTICTTFRYTSASFSAY